MSTRGFRVVILNVMINDDDETYEVPVGRTKMRISLQDLNYLFRAEAMLWLVEIQQAGTLRLVLVAIYLQVLKPPFFSEAMDLAESFVCLIDFQNKAQFCLVSYFVFC